MRQAGSSFQEQGSNMDSHRSALLGEAIPDEAFGRLPASDTFAAHSREFFDYVEVTLKRVRDCLTGSGDLLFGCAVRYAEADGTHAETFRPGHSP